MPIRNAAWYAANAVRNYPLDDRATAVDDAGHPVPPGILVDAALRFPSDLGQYLYLSALTVTRDLVSAVFLAVDDVLAPTAIVPAAAVALPRPIEPGRAYPVTALADGVAGWVVPGDGADEPYAGRLTTPRQGVLLARCARPYRPPPVAALGRFGALAGLTGTVTLLAGPDLALTVEDLPIDRRDGLGYRPTTAIVLRLADTLDRNVFAYYAGPCAARPESRTCPGTPLEGIDDVAPDCAGDLGVTFRGVTATPTDGGIVLDLDRGLGAVCADALPAADGTLPGTPTDRCADGTIPTTAVDPGACDPGPEAAARAPTAAAAVRDDMRRLPAAAGGTWEPAAGAWSVGLTTVPAAGGFPGGDGRLVKLAQDRAGTCLAFYRPADGDPGAAAGAATVATLVRPWAGPASSGGIAVATAGGVFLFLVNATAGALELWRGAAGDETSWVRVAAVPATVPADAWYVLRVALAAGRATATAVPAAGGPPATLVAALDRGAGPVAYGLGARHAWASFATFSLDLA